MAKGGSSVEGGSKYIGSNLVLYPNSMMIGAPEHVEFWTVWPALDSATRCTVNIRFLVRSEILDEQIEKRVHKRSEEHTSELQSLMRISSAVFCLKKKKKTHRL